MAKQEDSHPVQHIGGTVLVVMMDVDPEHEAEFNRWYGFGRPPTSAIDPAIIEAHVIIAPILERPSE